MLFSTTDPQGQTITFPVSSVAFLVANPRVPSQGGERVAMLGALAVQLHFGPQLILQAGDEAERLKREMESYHGAAPHILSIEEGRDDVEGDGGPAG